MVRVATGVAVLGLAIACGNRDVSSPFVQPGGTDGGDAAADAGFSVSEAGMARVADPTVGGPCDRDADCDDGIACTFDHCDPAAGRCRFVPDHAACADGVFCNGVEVCDARLGCRGGDPVDCSDGTVCSIKTCNETERSCEQSPRDADGDGDPDWNCGGGDCDDRDPRIASTLPEICANGRDDNCNGEIDEEPCESPQHDTCEDPLEVRASGSFELNPAAAESHYGTSCAPTGAAWRDLAVALTLPEGDPVDVDVRLLGASGRVALAAAEHCGDLTSEIACAEGVRAQGGTSIARLRLRELTPGKTYPLYALTDSSAPLTLAVEYLDPEPKPENESCAGAEPLVAGAPVRAALLEASDAEGGACGAAFGGLVYALTLTEARDLRIRATSLDGYGAPSLSLLSAACLDPSGPPAELTCRAGPSPELFVRAAAGTYFVELTATGPTEVGLLAEVEGPTVAPPHERCDGSPALAPGETVRVDLGAHTDDVQHGCLVGGADAAYALDLAEPSDVLLLARLSEGDVGAALLSRPGCEAADDVLACETGDRSPVRAAARGLQPGSHRAIVESARGSPASLTAFVRPARAPILVAFADRCGDAVPVPPEGGFFQGNTASASADYDASCDLGGQASGGAPEQMLRLTLDRRRRVVLDMRGSGHATLLSVRRGPGCPGTEVEWGCAPGYVPARSFLDLTLDAGDYFIQVDGYGGSKGAWFLDVFLAEP